jgi:hypothetical protein
LIEEIEMMRPNLRAHARDDLARHVEQRAEIGVDHGSPLIERHLMEGGVLGDAGIVDEDVDRSEVGLYFLDAGGAGLKRRDVPLVDGNAGVGLEFLGRGIVAGIACRNLVAGCLQRLADRRTNAARTSGYQCNTCHVEYPPRQ